jgi:predicted dehydrogenase
MESGSESQKQKQPRSNSAGATRRQMLQGGAAAAIAAMTFPQILSAQAKGANDRIRVACIGVGGKGGGDSDQAGSQGGEVVGLCDVDQKTLDGKAKQFPKAKTFRDFRKMLEAMDKDIDAVTISTPDHVHGIAAATAMSMGKHIYCQKPLTQTVYEARVLRKLAKDKKLATQMGNQGSAEDGLRRAVEVIQSGLIGKVHELHVWSNRPIWPQGIGRPEGEDPVPPTLDWDLWLGPAKFRPYKKDTYHTFAWRGWYDFGTGALGDMACHTVNMPFRALKMGYPNVVECEETSQLNNETYPKTSRLRFEFPEREGLPPLKFWWYDGNPQDKSMPPFRPPADVTKEILEMEQGQPQRRRQGQANAAKADPTLPGSGCLVIGDKGKIFSPDDYGASFFVMLDGEKKYTNGKEHEAAKAVEKTIPRATGPGGIDEKMKQEWFKMIRDGTPAYSNFDISAYLTEIILLGCIAMRVGVGRKMDWDGPNMKSTNVAEAAKFVRREARKGWELPAVVS